MPIRSAKTTSRSRRRVKGALKKVSDRPKKKGVDMSDLVGTIRLTVDPVEHQREMRDEW